MEVPKKSKKKNKKSKRKNETLKNRLKDFYDVTFKSLSSEHQSLLTIKDNKIMGKMNINELKKMPWMIGVNLFYSSVPEPYSVELELKKDKEIQKYITVYNGSVYLAKNYHLNNVIKPKKSRKKSKRNTKN
jgi:hypothetical protein